MKEKLKKQLDFLIEIDKMKNILRQTLLMDKSRQENDAEHSWHFALMALTLFEYTNLQNVDINRVIKMALLHDLVEIYAGDTFAYDVKGNEGKDEREAESADRLFSMLPEEQSNEFRSLWEEFDRMETPDAMYASAIDRLEPFISNYMTDGYTWVLHKVSVENVYKRMEPIRLVLPDVWEFVETVIKDSCEKGYIASETGIPDNQSKQT
jgi:putative hydrolase of HD superfamily